MSNTTRENLEGLQPRNHMHEEADNRIFLNVLDLAKEHQRIMIWTVNTNVFILAVSQMQRIPHKSGFLLARESYLDITQSMKLPCHLVHRRAKLCRYSTRSQAVTPWRSLLEKVKRMCATHEMCFLTLLTHSWKSLMNPVCWRMSVQETLEDLWYCSAFVTEEESWDLLTRFSNSCSVRIPVAWIEFLQPLQLWSNIPSELHINGATSRAKYTLHYLNFQVQLSGDGREEANENQTGQLCHKPIKAATS